MASPKKPAKPQYKKVQSDPIFDAPKTIKIKSDGTVLELENILHKSTHRKEILFQYKYIEASTTCGKLGTTVPLRKQDIEYIINWQIGIIQ